MGTLWMRCTSKIQRHRILQLIEDLDMNIILKEGKVQVWFETVSHILWVLGLCWSENRLHLITNDYSPEDGDLILNSLRDGMFTKDSVVFT